jgi:hypothetical protein
MRHITIPNGKAVPLGAYVKAWRAVKGMPFDAEITDWQWYPTKAGFVLADMRRGMEERINAGIPYIDRC